MNDCVKDLVVGESVIHKLSACGTVGVEIRPSNAFVFLVNIEFIYIFERIKRNITPQLVRPLLNGGGNNFVQIIFGNVPRQNFFFVTVGKNLCVGGFG